MSWKSLRTTQGVNLVRQIHKAWRLHQQSFRLAFKRSWPFESISFVSVLKMSIVDSVLTFQICPPTNHRERLRPSHPEWKEPSSGKLWMWRTDPTHLQNDPSMSHCRTLLSTNIQKRNTLQFYTAVEYYLTCLKQTPKRPNIWKFTMQQELFAWGDTHLITSTKERLWGSMLTCFKYRQTSWKNLGYSLISTNLVKIFSASAHISQQFQNANLIKSTHILFKYK